MWHLVLEETTSIVLAMETIGAENRSEMIDLPTSSLRIDEWGNVNEAFAKKASETAMSMDSRQGNECPFSSVT